MTPWVVARQAPLSMGFSRQGYCSGLPFPPPGDLPDPGVEPSSPALASRFSTTEPPKSIHCSILNTVLGYEDILVEKICKILVGGGLTVFKKGRQTIINKCGLPWWSSGKEPACQHRGHQFHPCSGKVPYTLGRLSPCPRAAEPAHSNSQRSATREESLLTAPRECPHAAVKIPTQPKPS